MGSPSRILRLSPACGQMSDRYVSLKNVEGARQEDTVAFGGPSWTLIELHLARMPAIC